MNYLNIYVPLLFLIKWKVVKNTNPAVNGAYVSLNVVNKLKNIYLLCALND